MRADLICEGTKEGLASGRRPAAAGWRPQAQALCPAGRGGQGHVRRDRQRREAALCGRRDRRRLRSLPKGPPRPPGHGRTSRRPEGNGPRSGPEPPSASPRPGCPAASPASCYRPLRSAPLLPGRIPSRQVIRRRRHRGIPAVPRPRPRRRRQLLPQVSDHASSAAIRSAWSRISASRGSPGGPSGGTLVTARNHPGTHEQPPRQHRTRRQDVTIDHSPQHQAQGLNVFTTRAARTVHSPGKNYF